jgi:hypothetical protein
VIGFNVCSVLGYTKTALIMGTNAISAVPKIKAKEREKIHQNERFYWGT